MRFIDVLIIMLARLCYNMIYRQHSVFLLIVAAFPHVEGHLIYLLFIRKRKQATLQFKLTYIANSVLIPDFLEKLPVMAATSAEDVRCYHILYGW